jgi:midasin (ATPase involved in ribosome maturation)
VLPQPGFYIVATMNPSGDFGKKELSPALRNRFTEIWVEPVTHPKYLTLYLQPNVNNDLKELVTNWLNARKINADVIPDLLFEFVCIFNLEIAEKFCLQKKMLTMRDIVWVLSFIEKVIKLGKNIIEAYGYALWILVIEGSAFYSLPPK